MQKFEKRFKEWENLGSQLGDFLRVQPDIQTPWQEELLKKVNVAVHHNGWFEKSQVLHALSEWSNALSHSSLSEWTSRYPEGTFQTDTPKRVGIVMAGNIPLVGLHDLLTVSLTGHTAVVKMSGDDNQLLPALLSESPEILEGIEWAERLNGVDAVIATGSDNTARYFEHYFGKYPNVIRKNRKSAAVLKGDESEETLAALGEDVFRYFGMGCRSVSKIYLPEDFDLDRIFSAWLPHQDVIQNNKYGNNYDYHRAILLLDRKSFLENGFVIMREHSQLSTPVGTVHYERYSDIESVHQELLGNAEAIQCVVGPTEWTDLPVVGFGESQSPRLWDYADGVDTVAFLSKLH
ncbi:MAG: acyl-CoA reductase [Flavobacteriia bacterium]|nr:acyl-CoA reductase [Flavobacteriia bacterium]